MRRGHMLILLILWAALCASLSPVQARVREASDPIDNSATRRLVESLADSGTDLPPYLARSQDVYLFITAGAAYTDVRVLADAAVDARRLARALESAEPGTSLAGATVEWSVDGDAAAHLGRSWGRLGRRAGANTVPLGALADALRRAGFAPHILLRVPRYARSPGLPPSVYGTRRVRWYDGHALAGVSTVTVSASAPTSALWPLALPLLFPLIGLTTLGLATRAGRDERLPLATRRRRFQALNRAPLFAFVLGMPLMIFIVSSPRTMTVADLWFGSGTTSVLVLPLALLFTMPLMFGIAIGNMRGVRLFGKPETAKVWQSDEEKALHKRMARWTLLPHFIGIVGLAAVVWFLPHRSPAYAVIHPLSPLLLGLGTALVPRLFRKQLAALTKRTMDDDLTFRARRFGQLLGTRPREVWVETGSRAAQFAAAFREKDHIIVTQKMRDEFTTAEMDFVLAHHAARLGQRNVNAVRLLFLTPSVLLLVMTLLLGLRSGPTAAFGAHVLSSSWFLPAFFGVTAFCVVLLIVDSQWAARSRVRLVTEADRRALEVTGNLAAAESALSKIMVENVPATTTMAGDAQFSGAEVQPERISARRDALRKASGELV